MAQDAVPMISATTFASTKEDQSFSAVLAADPKNEKTEGVAFDAVRMQEDLAYHRVAGSGSLRFCGFAAALVCCR
jgi:hypothetical protein